MVVLYGRQNLIICLVDKGGWLLLERASLGSMVVTHLYIIQWQHHPSKRFEESPHPQVLEEAAAIKSAGKAWYKTMMTDSDYAEFENFSKWLGVTR
ncbi:uncharacterized protein A4U43_C07F32300 [Asparagus officinalis]|uniref:Uncharacterized protein n=1 Tax=Asparagus officinalis TaxID=4686 RepID=A0A5P1EJM0_ASPOF|nr:uncharacterized protein A4U43_C07F32300 [Asparagus officinalis]